SGAHFLRMIRKFVGKDVFDRAINKYLLDNSYGNGDTEKIIHCLLETYEGDRAQLEKILREWIYQPGVAMLFLESKHDKGRGHRIEIRQKRFHSSGFDDRLKDEKTRFTIPLFCTIDGEDRTILLKSEGFSS
ncbi:hypothetical protein PMAYCL1PPCAC_32276, partial [Pristionchus mayeri]